MARRTSSTTNIEPQPQSKAAQQVVACTYPKPHFAKLPVQLVRPILRLFRVCVSSAAPDGRPAGPYNNILAYRSCKTGDLQGPPSHHTRRVGQRKQKLRTSGAGRSRDMYHCIFILFQILVIRLINLFVATCILPVCSNINL